MDVAVIAGLGNPGDDYEATRHNLGFWLVDALAASLGYRWRKDRKLRCELSQGVLGDRSIILVKPQLFMNRSGECLSRLSGFFKIPAEAFLICYDDITLEPARLKLSLSGSAGGHNGVQNVLNHLGTGFARFRIGIGGRPHPEMDLAEYVLGKLSLEEQAVLKEALPHFLAALRLILETDPEHAMQTINHKSRA